jgi:hypothetical protein
MKNKHTKVKIKRKSNSKKRRNKYKKDYLQLWGEKQTLIEKYRGNNVRKREIIHEFTTFNHNLQPMTMETDDEVRERDIGMENTVIVPDFDNNILAGDPFGRNNSKLMLKDLSFSPSRRVFSFLSHPESSPQAYRSRNVSYAYHS